MRERRKRSKSQRRKKRKNKEIKKDRGRVREATPEISSKTGKRPAQAVSN